MFRVPGTMKIRDGVTKRLLREAMRGILPEETRTRIKKTGWNAPAHVWFSGAGLERLQDLVARAPSASAASTISAGRAADRRARRHRRLGRGRARTT